jgi:hypothetical protein
MTVVQTLASCVRFPIPSGHRASDKYVTKTNMSVLSEQETNYVELGIRRDGTKVVRKTYPDWRVDVFACEVKAYMLLREHGTTTSATFCTCAPIFVRALWRVCVCVCVS